MLFPSADNPSDSAAPDAGALGSATADLGLTAADFDEIEALVEQRLSEVEARFD